ncbi:MAG: alpha/beta hydrolase [Verrucomicrobiota bacterium]
MKSGSGAKSILARIGGLMKLMGGIKPGLYFRKSPTPTLSGRNYGEDDQQVFDLWKGDSGKGAVVFFHGGGFVRGKRYFSKALREAHTKGITAVAGSYRQVRRRDTDIRDAMEDAGRLISYLKEHAQELEIDPERIAVTGNSAGGILALLCALRPSIVSGRDNRVVAAACYNTPTLIDPFRFKELLDLDSLDAYWIFWSQMFKIDRLDQVSKPECQQLIRDCSPELWLTKESPPIHLTYSQTPDLEEDSLHARLHSAKFGVDFHAKAQDLGAPITLSHADSPNTLSKEDFLILAVLQGSFEQETSDLP